MLVGVSKQITKNRAVVRIQHLMIYNYITKTQKVSVDAAHAPAANKQTVEKIIIVK